MKITALIQRRHRDRASPGVSLFPFLAVLICTMGALVLLLFAVTRAASRQAAAEAAAKVAQQQGDVKTERDMIHWRIGELKKSRQQTESQLSEARLYLGHLEEHAQRLRSQLGQLQASTTELQRQGAGGSLRREEIQEELRKVKADTAEAQRRLGDAKEAADKRPRSFAIIPYEGPNQTRRRPIYIECRADAVVLQPEGIVLTEADFDGPLGPGNPLAAALRAQREYLLARGSLDPERFGEPYPLLLVRPEGIDAYYAARTAMKSWGSEFGYELIGDDWKLQFPPPDPQLAQAVRQTLEAARVRQEQLAAAAPRHYSSRSNPSYRVATTRGGIVQEGDGGDEPPTGFRRSQPSGLVANRYGSSAGAAGGGRYPGGVSGSGANAGGSGDPTMAGGPGRGESGESRVEGSGDPTMAGGPGGSGVGGGLSTGGGSFFGGASGNATSSSGVPGGVPGGGTGGSPGGVPGGVPAGAPNGMPGGVPGGMAGATASSGGSTPSGGMTPSGGGFSPSANGAAPGRTAGTSGSSGQNATGQPRQPADGTGRVDGYLPGQPLREEPRRPRFRGDDDMDGPRGSPLRPGEWQPSVDMPPPKPDDKDKDKKDEKQRKSLATKRGRDWGLRDAAHGSVAIARPIRVDCYVDRLLIPSEKHGAAPKEISLGQRTEASVDDMISAVWEHMEAWGIAGKGMYWRPELIFYVTPGAEQRFAELEVLLEGSGVVVKRKS